MHIYIVTHNIMKPEHTVSQVTHKLEVNCLFYFNTPYGESET